MSVKSPIGITVSIEKSGYAALFCIRPVISTLFLTLDT